MPELKNIDRLPAAAQKPISEFAAKLLALHGTEIESIVVFGSAAGPNFTPKISDINLAVIFYSINFAVVHKSAGLARRGRKHRITAPLFLTREYIHDSMDVFPIEFAEIKDHHVPIYGADIFRNLSIDEKHVKILCKGQVRGKILRVRQAYLDCGGDPHAVKKILVGSLNSLVPVFRQLLRISGLEPAIEKPDVLRQMAGRFFLDVDVLTAVYQHKIRRTPLKHSQVDDHFKNYLQQLQQLAIRIDRL